MPIDPIVRTIFLAGFWTVIGILGWNYFQTCDKWTMFPKLSRRQKVLLVIGFALIAVAFVGGVITR
jgi:hypothetical protein